MQNRFGPRRRANEFPFQPSNRNKDGTWDAPLADRDNILGTSVDPHEPQWPRWKRTPPPHHEGDFVSDDPFYDVDEISGKVEFYPPGRALRDGNVDGNPARRQRVDDLPAGNSWRRRLLVGHADELPASGGQQDHGFVRVAGDSGTPTPGGPRRVHGIPPPPDPRFVPDWRLPKPVTIPFPNPSGGEPRYRASEPGWIYDQPYWEIRPGQEPNLYTPNGPRNLNPDRNGNSVPDNVEPGNPTGSYLFPALISALRQRRSLG